MTASRPVARPVNSTTSSPACPIFGRGRTVNDQAACCGHGVGAAGVAGETPRRRPRTRTTPAAQRRTKPPCLRWNTRENSAATRPAGTRSEGARVSWKDGRITKLLPGGPPGLRPGKKVTKRQKIVSAFLRRAPLPSPRLSPSTTVHSSCGPGTSPASIGRAAKSAGINPLCAGACSTVLQPSKSAVDSRPPRAVNKPR